MVVASWCVPGRGDLGLECAMEVTSGLAALSAGVNSFERFVVWPKFARVRLDLTLVWSHLVFG